jgi:RNA polymerase sigma factor (sigma-70 family)
MPRSFDEIYDEHVWRVYGFIAYRVGSREDAEDLTSQTFEKALRAWHRYDERRAPPGAWLITIARNLVIDHFRGARAQAAHAPLHDVPDSAMPAGAGTEPDLGVSPELARALGRLEDREREVLALRFGADLTGQQIADVTGMTLANAQQVLSRTLRRLRVELEGERPDLSAGPQAGEREQQRADPKLPNH